MRYLRAGSGPPIILLHGLLGYSFSWRFTMPALAPYRTVYAPDMLGSGFSERPRDLDASLAGAAGRVIEFARILGLSSVDLLGTSRGGAVAMAAAAACVVEETHLQVQKLILVAPVNPYSAQGKRLAALLGNPIVRAIFRSTVARMSFLYPRWHGRMFGDRGKIPPDSLPGYEAPLVLPGVIDHALRIVRTWSSDLRRLEGILPRIACIPTLLIWGSKDPAVYACSAEPLANHFRNVQQAMFPGVGHLPYEECPEEFNRAVVDFLCNSVP